MSHPESDCVTASARSPFFISNTILRICAFHRLFFLLQFPFLFYPLSLFFAPTDWIGFAIFFCSKAIV